MPTSLILLATLGFVEVRPSVTRIVRATHCPTSEIGVGNEVRLVLLSQSHHLCSELLLSAECYPVLRDVH